MTTALVIVVSIVVLVAIVVGMILLRRRQDNAWRQLASETGAEFLPGGLFRSSKVQAHLQQSTVTLDTYSVPSGDSSTTYTRIRAPLQSKSPFEFTVFREGLVGKLDKALGMQDIEIGIPDFDENFIVQANDRTKVNRLLTDPRIRELIQQQKRIRLRLKKDELYFEAQGVIRDVERLKSLFQLFEQTLHYLEE